MKSFWKSNERNILTIVAFSSVFLLGFFTGRIDSFNSNAPVVTIEKSLAQSTIFNETSQPQEASGSGAVTDGGCTTGQIKGNISSSDKVYHVPGGSFYNRTQPEQCFNTEAEAQAAGFRKSSR